MRRAWSLFSLLAIACGLAAAQPPAHWREWIAELAENNPTLEAAQKTLEAARQRAPQAGSLPDPMIGIRSQSLPSPLPFHGVGREMMATAGIMVSQQFPARGTRKLRYQIARTEAEAQRQTYEQVWNTLVGEMQRAWLDIRYTWDAEDLLNESEQLLAEMLRGLEARYASGDATQQDLLRTQTQVSLLAIKRESLHQMRRVAEARLNALLARDPVTTYSRPANTEAVQLPESPAPLLASLSDTSPVLHAAESRIQARSLGVSLARKGYQPETRISGAYMNRGGMAPMWELSVEFSIPAWFRTKQRPEVAERSMELAAARREYEAALHELGFQVQEQYEIARSASRLMKIYDDTLIPQAQLRFESATTAYEAGNADFASLFDGLMEMIDFGITRLEQRRNLEVAVSRLGELTGKELLP